VTRARRFLLVVVACLLAGTVVPVAAQGTPSGARDVVPSPTAWIQQIRDAIGGRPVSVAVGVDGALWYRHLDWVPRPPASNEKLLLSMALYDRFPATMTFRTQAMVAKAPGAAGVVHGDLWIVGHGDPEVGRDDLRALAKAIADAGVTSIRGAVVGDTGPFGHDWFAPGWKDYFPADYVALPTALTFRGNVDRSGVHIRDPELRAARFLTATLEGLGIHIRKDPSARRLTGPTVPLAEVHSAPLSRIVRRMDLKSRNFYAEVLGKKLGSVAYGRGTIADAGRAIHAFTTAHGVAFTEHDASGLSYANRATVNGIVHLLWDADQEPWLGVLQASLPHAGQGTLEGRLRSVALRAKTGTLDDASALSGWVWLQRSGQWAEFSILSSGFSEWTAKTIEDRIVRAISANAVDPASPV
jgi:D-alanyl-D-alanine carboxypeptidase